MAKARIETLEAAYEEAVKLLARKARTAREVEGELLARGAPADDVASVVARLKAHRHLDDAALAGDEAFTLVDGKGWAPAAAVQILVERGVPPAVARDAVDAACEGRGEGDLCQAALARRLKGRPLAPSLAAKEGRALARLGYEEDVVTRVLERALARPEEEA